MSVAFLFPGQGVDVRAYAAEWYAESAAARALLDHVSRLTDVPIAALLHASGRAVADTAVYQPAMTAICLGALAELDARGVRASVVAGHSLGEVAACVAAGVITRPEAAVALAAARGRAMKRAAERCPGGLLSVTAPARAVAEEALSLACAAGGWAQIAGQNAPDQWLLAGDWSALNAVPLRFAPRAVPTGGAWHSVAMTDAVDDYGGALRAAIDGPPRVSLVCNRTGGLVTAADDLVACLADQLTHPVEWATSMATLADLGVRSAVTVGPAKALRVLARRNLGDAVRVLAVDVPGDVLAVAEALSV